MALALASPLPLLFLIFPTLGTPGLWVYALHSSLSPSPRARATILCPIWAPIPIRQTFHIAQQGVVQRRVLRVDRSTWSWAPRAPRGRARSAAIPEEVFSEAVDEWRIDDHMRCPVLPASAGLIGTVANLACGVVKSAAQREVETEKNKEDDMER